MKHLLSICLLLVLLLSALSSCGNSEPEVGIATQDPASILDRIRGEERWQTPVDYSLASNWLAFDDAPSKRADVLYFYPECYTAPSGGDVVCSIDNAQMRGNAPKYLSTQAAVFTDECNLYAPFYRQIDREYLMSMEREDRELFYEYEAARDIAAALDYYFENINNGRPFFLAGHGQGSDMVRFIAARYLADHKEYKNRMVAAYAIGTAVNDAFLSKYHLKFASGASDTGVIISYNTEGQGNYGFFASELIVRLHTKVINPMSWKNNDKTSVLPFAHLGMLMEDGSIESNKISTHLNLERGTVVVDNEEMQSYAMTGHDAELYGPQCYHNYDYQFFFINLKENVRTRLNAWLTK